MTRGIGSLDQSGLNVSRETMLELELYTRHLTGWNKKINLVSKSSMNDSWNRHFLDSAQIYFGPGLSAEKWVDLGSGAGFPGLVVAILAKGAGQDLETTLVESDSRKCEFLRHISRLTNTPVTIRNSRIEDTELEKADIVSARALSPLKELIGYAEKFLKPDGHCLFLKGSNVDMELTEASGIWHMNYKKIQSKTDSNGVILQVDNIQHV